MMSRFYDVTE